MVIDEISPITAAHKSSHASFLMKRPITPTDIRLALTSEQCLEEASLSTMTGNLSCRLRYSFNTVTSNPYGSSVVRKHESSETKSVSWNRGKEQFEWLMELTNLLEIGNSQFA